MAAARLNIHSREPVTTTCNVVNTRKSKKAAQGRPLEVVRFRYLRKCASETKSVTVDSNWRWLHEAGAPHNCYTGNLWNGTLCPDPPTCAPAARSISIVWVSKSSVHMKTI